MDLLEPLKAIPCSNCSYQEWVDVGMALKHEGYSVADWDQWSRHDRRYKTGECYDKWKTFTDESLSLVTGGTIYYLAEQYGWSRPQKGKGHAVEWDDNIGTKVIPDIDQLEVEPVPHLFKGWNPFDEISEYLLALFGSDEHPGIVLRAHLAGDGRVQPEKGTSSRTTEEIIKALNKYRKDGRLDLALGDYNHDLGAWCRVNPMDGEGAKDRNVTDYRYCLVESDELDIDQQYTLLKELELPIVTLTYSGGKSLHAIVRVDAKTERQYRERVQFVYEMCDKNGLAVDKANKNPSRLTRIPGFERNGNKQYLVACHIGKKSFEEWQDFINGIVDDLPDIDNYGDCLDSGLPDLKPEFWEGIARVGSKVLISGPSKAGKTAFLIEMAISIAEGRPLLEREMVQGPVCVINMEVDRAEYLHRVQDAYRAMDLTPTEQGKKNLFVWNMRGHSEPLSVLGKKLINRLKKQPGGYAAVILDPLYKVLTGDENSASEMSKFCNELDKICNELNTTLVYAHHFSKGAQGGKKSIDRASGSGVFGRDPDAILSLTELPLSDDDKVFRINSFCCTAIRKKLIREHGWDDTDFTDENKWDQQYLKDELYKRIPRNEWNRFQDKLNEDSERIRTRTAWRLEGTLRSFPTPEPINMFYEYPLHVIDETGELKNKQPECEKDVWQRGNEKSTEVRKTAVKTKLETLEELVIENKKKLTVKQAAQLFGVKSVNTVKTWINDSENLTIVHGKIRPVSEVSEVSE